MAQRYGGKGEYVLWLCGSGGLAMALVMGGACSGADDANTEGAPEGGDASPTVTATCALDPATADYSASVAEAANDFLTTLTDAQRSVALVERTRADAVQWSNFPAGVVMRNGVKLADMSEDAQGAALALAGIAASTTGSTLLADVRAADEAFRTSSGDQSLFGDGQYYFSIHGTPTGSSNWMLQIAGHHFVYNFTYNGTCTSATPLFDGAQPAQWTDTAGQVHDPLAAQRDAMADLFAAVGSSDGAQLSGVYSDMINGPAAVMGGASAAIDSKYPASLTYPTTDRGASVAAFSSAQKDLVKVAIEAWVNNAADPVSSALLDEYESDAALAETYVAYSGAADLSTTLSYGRIDGPRVWIEFTVQEGTAGGTPGHYHTIWRDKAADYGADFRSP